MIFSYYGIINLDAFKSRTLIYPASQCSRLSSTDATQK